MTNRRRRKNTRWLRRCPGQRELTPWLGIRVVVIEYGMEVMGRAFLEVIGGVSEARLACRRLYPD